MVRRRSDRLVARKPVTEGARRSELEQVHGKVNVMLWALVIIPAILAVIFVPFAVYMDHAESERLREQRLREIDREREEREQVNRMLRASGLEPH